SLAEFKYLYANSPRIRRAELIEGVVYVASPVYLPHASSQMLILTLLGVYQSQTPKVRGAGEISVEIDNDNEVQPDAAMWKPDDITAREDKPILGSPSLVIEVAASTRSYDLGVKKQVYRRNRVQEYLVLAAHEQEVHWFYWDMGIYKKIEPDDAGVYRSRVFPGLWLDALAFWQNDSASLLATLNLGLNSAEHHTFVQSLS
ncbi:MAG TPA: Uma2 family endonuclease, partial [Anaerolineae bacterium]|nr:Uma2 family endonuclease [Anaerolineae bacterium]